MPSVYLDRIKLQRESKSFTDSLYAVLTAADLFEGPKYLLSGLTGMAFKFTVHERLLPLSVSAYGNWGTEHGPAVDNLGLLMRQDGGRTRHLTFRSYQRQWIDRVKRSLDRGVGVLYWIPEFGVIHGYDDDDGIFYVQDGYSKEERILLFDNLGLNFTEFWYVAEIGEKADVPLEKGVLESVRLAWHDWVIPHKTLPNTDIASGRLAYTFLIQALESGQFHEAGARYIVDSYVYARQEIMLYLQDVRYLWPELAAACQLYKRLVDLFRDWNLQDARRLADALAAAAALEDQAMGHFRQLSERFPDPLREHAPRWGMHSPR